MRNLEDLTQTRRPNGDFQLPPSCDYQRPPNYDFVRGGGSGTQVQPHQWPVGKSRVLLARGKYLSLGITELKPEPIFHYDYLPMVAHVPVAQTSFWQHTEEDFARGKTYVHGNLFCSLRVDGKVENYPWVVEISTLACRCRKLKAGLRLKKSRTPKEFLQELFKLAYGQQHTKDIFLSYIRIEVSEDVAMQQSELSDRTSLQQFQDWRPKVLGMDNRGHASRILRPARAMLGFVTSDHKAPIPLVALGLTCSVTPSHYGTSIRPDAVALGFDAFSIAYDPKRILCIFAASCRRDDEAVQMIFFHKEGMATFFGLGLSFALVFLNANGEVEVEEVRENFWRQLWMTSSEQFGSLALFELSDSISCPGRGVTLSTEDAALHFGVSVEGSTCIPFDIEPREASESRAGSAGNTQQIKSPDWIKALYEHMRQLITGKVPHDTEMMGAEEAKNTDVKMASISSANALHGCTRSSVPSHSDMFSPPFPFRLVDSGTEGHGKYYNNLQRLTVKVYLTPESYTFYSPSDRVDLVLGTDMGTQKFINPLTGEVIDTVDTDICVHQMRPVVTITFLFHEGGKDASKQIKTELAVDYLLNGDVEENPLKFGWYHDKLKLSFKCKVPAAVRRETKDMATEVLSKHETRFTVRGQGKETTYSLVKGMGGVVKIFGGSRNIVGAEVTLNRKRETTRSSTERQDSSIPVQLTFLEKANFSIKRVDEGAELAYMATIYPSIKQYDLWNYDDRHLACESGMMSAVQLIIQGLWSVMDSDDLHVIPNRLCEYVFTCQRNFRSEKKVVSEVASTNFLFERKKMKTVETIDDITIQQTLSRNFLINHSFSHMQRLRRPEEYMWDINRTPQAPFPVNGILS